MDYENCGVVVGMRCWGKNCGVVVVEMRCWGKNCGVVVVGLRFVLSKILQCCYTHAKNHLAHLCVVPIYACLFMGALVTAMLASWTGTAV